MTCVAVCLLICAREQKAHGYRVGVIDGHCKQKYMYNFKQFEAYRSQFLPIYTDSLSLLQHTHVPKSQDPAIFVLTNVQQTDKINHFTPCVCAQGSHYIQLAERSKP